MRSARSMYGMIVFKAVGGSIGALTAWRARPAMQNVDNLNCDFLRHPLHCFDGTGSQMGRENDPVIASQGAVFRQRLFFEYIESRAGKVTARNCGGQRLLVDDSAAGDIDNAGAKFHLLQSTGINKVTRCFSQGYVHGQEIHTREHVVDGKQCNPSLRGVLLADKGIACEYTHPHAMCELDHLLGNTTQPHDAKRFAPYFGADKRAPIPLLRAYILIRLGYVSS